MLHPLNQKALKARRACQHAVSIVLECFEVALESTAKLSDFGFQASGQCDDSASVHRVRHDF